MKKLEINGEVIAERESVSELVQILLQRLNENGFDITSVTITNVINPQ